jgi:hypothetical protein
LEYDTEFVETPWTIRGNILHEYGERKLLEKETETFENENKFSDYEKFLINGYVQAVMSEYNLIQADKMQIEVKEPIEIFGNTFNSIIDALLLAKRIASIIDLKTGNNDVAPDENEQLLFYAYGVLLRNPQIEIFRLSIFQKGKLKTEVVTREYIYDFFMEKFEVFDAISKNELTYNPSEKACKYCAFKEKCVARAKWVVGGKDD